MPSAIYDFYLGQYFYDIIMIYPLKYTPPKKLLPSPNVPQNSFIYLKFNFNVLHFILKLSLVTAAQVFGPD